MEAKRLIGYVRVSTDEQARNGVSVAVQRDRIEAYCRAQGCELISVESDEGISGSVSPARRRGLADVLSQLRRGDADGLVVLRLDRLSRSTRDVLDLVERSRREQWHLVSVSEHFDTASAAGRLVVTVLAALAEMERGVVAERTRAALAQVAREGRGRSRFTPFGWLTADGGTELAKGDRRPLVMEPGEQQLLVQMRALQGEGLGARRIAAALNSAGLVNPRTGRAWSYRSVERILGSQARREEALAA